MTLKNIAGIETEQRKSKTEKYSNTGKEQTMLKRRIQLLMQMKQVFNMLPTIVRININMNRDNGDGPSV